MRAACLALACLSLSIAVGPAAARPGRDCAPREVRAALTSFIAAYNAGDYDALDDLVAAEPDFRWYSSPVPGERLLPRASRRGTLVRYFEARHAARDRLALTSFGFNGNGTYGGSRYGNFEMGLRRRAAGFRRGAWFRADGKGAATCKGDSVRFVVLTLGGPAPL